jgi:farnesyl diphosphate synthase
MMPVPEFEDWRAQRLRAVETAMQSWVSDDALLTCDHPAPADLVQAMRYAVLDGGKRLRPLLVLASFECVQAGASPVSTGEDFAEAARRSGPIRADRFSDSGQPLRWPDIGQGALRAACAVELIHAYSLVHDDMPCMDNDVLRRGKPTVHVQFGHAQALLAGDALQALAFELLVPEGGDDLTAAQQARLCRLLARAAGCAGMAGGQAIDLASVGHTLSEAELRHMHQLKTGALLQASVLMGAACSDPDARAWSALKRFGQAIGLAFQVVDDVLDVTADSATLGKTAGKDAEQDKPTYVSLMGLEAAQAYAHSLLHQALDALADSGLDDTRLLAELALRIIDRTH